MRVFDLKVGFSCNNNCIHCVVADKRHTQELTSAEIKGIIDSLDPEWTIRFSGGEPTIRPDFLELIKYARDVKRHHVELQTNGAMFSNEFFAKEAVKYLDRILLTIHSSDSEIHDKIARNPGVLDKTINGIKNLLKYRQDCTTQATIDTQTVISKLNIHTLSQTCAFIQGIAPETKMNVVYSRPMGSAYLYADVAMPRYSEIKKYVQQALEQYEQYICTEAIPPCYLYPYHEQQKKPECMKCELNNKCAMTWKGYISKGNLDLLSIISLNENGIEMQKSFNFQNYKKVEQINKGFTMDKKYCLTKSDGTKYLLRIMSNFGYKEKKMKFDMQKRIAELGISMCMPVEFGSSENSVYSLQSWIDGEELIKKLLYMTETEQYNLGLKAGKFLQKIHSIPVPETIENWATYYNRKIDMKIKAYSECDFRFNDDDKIIAYIKQNRHLLTNRPRSLLHGDYYVRNMMLENGELTIIDFNCKYEDPWRDLMCVYDTECFSKFFMSGLVNGYFECHPPEHFWRILLLYVAENTVSCFLSVILKESEQRSVRNERFKNYIKNIFSSTENLQNQIPAWYLKSL